MDMIEIKQLGTGFVVLIESEDEDTSTVEEHAVESTERVLSIVEDWLGIDYALINKGRAALVQIERLQQEDAEREIAEMGRAALAMLKRGSGRSLSYRRVARE